MNFVEGNWKGGHANPVLPKKMTALGRKICLLLILLALPLAVKADPVMFNPSSFLAFGVVAFFALLVETGIVTVALFFNGVALMPVFWGYFIANIAVFLFVFLPLLDSGSASAPVLEVLVVLLDGLAIKLLTSLNSFQGAEYRRVGWWRAFVISCIGNAVSYFIGAIASQRPWEIG